MDTFVWKITEIDIGISHRYPKNNFIGINSERRSPGYLASMLISMFDILYRINPKLWQLVSYDDYKVEYTNAGWCIVRSNIDFRDSIVIAVDSDFYVSSPQTCIELQRHIKHKYNEEIRVLSIPHNVRRYLILSYRN